MAFTGYSEPYTDELDYVAIFDGSSWTLQLLSGALKVQYVPSDHLLLTLSAWCSQHTSRNLSRMFPFTSKDEIRYLILA